MAAILFVRNQAGRPRGWLWHLPSQKLVMTWPGRGRKRWGMWSKGRQDVRRIAGGVTVKEESYKLKEKSVFILSMFSLVLSLTSLLLLYIRGFLQIVRVWFPRPKWERGEVFGAALILELTVQGKRPLFSKLIFWSPGLLLRPLPPPLPDSMASGPRGSPCRQSGLHLSRGARAPAV